jgi:hypothetical protein
MSEPRYDALLLASSAMVYDEKAHQDRHLNAALAAGARKLNIEIDAGQAERLLPILRGLISKKR